MHAQVDTNHALSQESQEEGPGSAHAIMADEDIKFFSLRETETSPLKA